MSLPTCPECGYMTAPGGCVNPLCPRCPKYRKPDDFNLSEDARHGIVTEIRKRQWRLRYEGVLPDESLMQFAGRELERPGQMGCLHDLSDTDLLVLRDRVREAARQGH